MNEKNRDELEERRRQRAEEALRERLEGTNSIIEPEPVPSLIDKVLGPFESLYWRVKNAPKRRNK